MDATHSWTCSVYHTAAVAAFTAALTAEVRRQEDVYDETSQALAIQKEVADQAYVASCKERYPPHSRLCEEDIHNYTADSDKLHCDALAELKSKFPLGYEGVDPDGALGAYRMRTALLRHVERIERERRLPGGAASGGVAAAVAAPTADLRPLPPLVKTEEADGGSGMLASPPAGAASAALLFAKREGTDGDSAAPLSHAGTDNSVGAQAARGPAGEPAKAESRDEWSSHLAPLWPSRTAAARRTDTETSDCGAYLVPRPTAPGTPFLRYVSSPHCAGATVSPALPLPSPTLVVEAPAPPVEAPSTETVSTQLTASQPRSVSQGYGGRGRAGVSSPPSTPAPPSQASQRAMAKRARGRSTSLASAAPDPAEEVMKLWWTLRPGLQTEQIGEAGEAASIRPTSATVTAVAQVAMNNLQQGLERCRVQQRRIAEYLEADPASHGSGEAASADTGKRKDDETEEDEDSELLLGDLLDDSRQSTQSSQQSVHFSYFARRQRRAAVPVPNREDLVAQQQHLREEEAEWERRIATHGNVVQELLRLLESDSIHSAQSTQDDDNNESEEGRAAATQPTATQRGSRKRRRGSSACGQQSGRGTLAAAAAAAAGVGVKEGAAHSGVERSAVETAAGRQALLRTLLADPWRLLRDLATANYDGPAWLTTRPQSEAKCTASSTPAVETIDLPPAEDDATAADLEPYMWPAELESRICHHLHGHTSLPSKLMRGFHLCLSRTAMQQVEERAAAGPPESAGAVQQMPPVLAVVEPDLGTHVVGLPKAGTQGWLYVQGRGEILAATLELL